MLTTFILTPRSASRRRLRLLSFPPLLSQQAAARLAASEGLAIRGASTKVATTSVARLRRNTNTPSSIPRLSVVSTKIIDLWRQFVRARYNPEAKFLNLEVSVPLHPIHKPNHGFLTMVAGHVGGRFH